MIDLVERLRFDAVRCELQFSKGVAGNIEEAADGIERLRAEIERLRNSDLVERFHPDRNMPGCMMPDGGACCAGHAALVEDWHRQRDEIERLGAEIKQMKNEVSQYRQAAKGDAEIIFEMHDEIERLRELVRIGRQRDQIPPGEASADRKDD